MRRVAAGIAGVLSVLAAALLPAVWYDDGTAARRGPAVLAPIAGRPDDLPGLGWLRTAAVLACVAVLAAVPAAVAALRRSRPAGTPAAGPTADADPAAGRGATTAGRGARAAAGWAAGWHAAAAVALGLAAWRLGGAATPAVPRAAVLLAGAAAGWALAATRLRLAGSAAVAVAAVVAVAAPLGGPWWVHGRLAGGSTTDAPPPAAGTGGPAAPGAVAWTRDAAAAVAFGPYLVLRRPDPDGTPRISVLDAAAGSERWSYRQAGGYTAISADPATGVLVLAVDSRARELRAFDLASGRPLWNRRDAAEVVGQTGRWQAAGILLPAGTLLLLDRRATRLRALDPRTGTERWRRPVQPECASSATYVRAGDVLVGTSLCERTTLPAVRADTGADAWTATLSGRPVRSADPSRPALLAAGVLGVPVEEGAGSVLVALDTGTGRVLWRRPTTAAALPWTVVAGRFVLAEPRPGRSRDAVAVDPRTGRAAWTTRLPAVPERPEPDANERLAGSDGEHWYLLTGTYPGGPGTARLLVLDAGGRFLGSAALPGCGTRCRSGQVPVSGSGTLAAAGGTLLVVPPRPVAGRPVVAIGPGPAFTPAG